MPRRHALRWAMQVIAAETPKSSAFAGHTGAAAAAAHDDDEDDCLDYDYDEEVGR
jgi:hypothetical protein